MKLFKVIALVALSLNIATQAYADVGRATDADQVAAGSFVCEVTGKIVKRHVASPEVRKTEQRAPDTSVGSTRIAQ